MDEKDILDWCEKETESQVNSIGIAGYAFLKDE